VGLQLAENISIDIDDGMPPVLQTDVGRTSIAALWEKSTSSPGRWARRLAGPAVVIPAAASR
jgi:hypothetical protein